MLDKKTSTVGQDCALITSSAREDPMRGFAVLNHAIRMMLAFLILAAYKNMREFLRMRSARGILDQRTSSAGCTADAGRLSFSVFGDLLSRSAAGTLVGRNNTAD